MEIKSTINAPHISLQSFPSQTRLAGTEGETVLSHGDQVRSSDGQYLVERLRQPVEVRQDKVDEAIHKLNSGAYLTNESAQATADAILAHG